MRNSNQEDQFEHDDIIYTDDVKARIEHLDGLYAHAEDTSDWEDDYADEYAALSELRTEIASTWGNPAWNNGISLVADSYWNDYAQNYAKDVFGEAAKTPYWNHVKWAEDTQINYSYIEYAGVKYWGDGSR